MPVLEVGTGLTGWPAVLAQCGFVVTTIDNMRDYWPASAVNRHWSFRNVDITAGNAFHDSARQTGPRRRSGCKTAEYGAIPAENGGRRGLLGDML